MNNRELFHATMRGDNGNKLLHLEQGFNIPTEEWIRDGMPENIKSLDFADPTPEENLYDHLNVSGHVMIRYDQFCLPAFESKVIEEKEGRVTVLDKNGVVRQYRSDWVYGSKKGSLPHEIAFTIDSPKTYDENRFRLIGQINERQNLKMSEEKKMQIRVQNDYIVALWVHGPFAYMRELMGTENAMILPYTEPEMIRKMLKDHLERSMAVSEQLIREMKPDISFVWEDCCGSTGPFISPGIFEEMMAPWFREWKDFIKSSGLNWITLDSDGDPSPLVRLWYENGVDCLEPWEVNSVDMLKFAEEYPQYTMMGGIYKHIFEPGDPSQVGRFKTTDIKKTIDDELQRVVKHMRKRGKYIISLDHWPFWGVKYESYRYFCRQLEEKYGKSNIVTRKFVKGF